MQTKIIILILVIVVIISGVILWQSGKTGKGDIIIATDKNEYTPQDNLKIQIQNKLGESACFSSCYPYFIERKDGAWDQYEYTDCPKTNLNAICVEAGGKKAFELALPSILSGLHRLSVSACLGCQIGDTFKGDKKFYSNEFLVK